MRGDMQCWSLQAWLILLTTMSFSYLHFESFISGSKRHRLFETCSVSLLLLSPFPHAVFVCKTSSISYLLSAAHMFLKAVPGSAVPFPAKFSGPSCAPDILPFPRIYFFKKILVKTIITRCWKMSFGILMKTTSSG